MEIGQTLRTFWTDLVYTLTRIDRIQTGKKTKTIKKLYRFEPAGHEGSGFTQHEDEFNAAVRKHTFIIEDQL